MLTFSPLLRMQQDYDFFLRLGAFGVEFRGVPNVLVDYILHDGNASRDYRTAFNERVACIREHADLAARRQMPAAVRAAQRGLARRRELYGYQAFDAFRESRRIGDLRWAMTLSPAATADAVLRWPARKLLGRIRRPSTAPA